MSLRKHQSEFMRALGLLILYAYHMGYELTGGDLHATSGHKNNSLHYRKLAIDLNLFKDGEYLTETDDHRPLGAFWESLDERCRWGGRWNDGNHYEYLPYGRNEEE